MPRITENHHFELFYNFLLFIVIANYKIYYPAKVAVHRMHAKKKKKKSKNFMVAWCYFNLVAMDKCLMQTDRCSR